MSNNIHCPFVSYLSADDIYDLWICDDYWRDYSEEQIRDLEIIQKIKDSYVCCLDPDSSGVHHISFCYKCKTPWETHWE